MCSEQPGEGYYQEKETSEIMSGRVGSIEGYQPDKLKGSGCLSSHFVLRQRTAAFPDEPAWVFSI